MEQLNDINDVSDFLSVLPEHVKGDSHHMYLKFWYRGEADKRWLLKPKIFRPDFHTNDGFHEAQFDRHLSQDFKVFSAGLRNGDETDADLYFLQQHYGMPTRLLDWTTNPLSALFFAVNSNFDLDARLVRMNAYSLAEVQGLKRGATPFEGIASRTNLLFVQQLDKIINFSVMEPELVTGVILPVRPNYKDKRITLQSGCFTFHGYQKIELTDKESNTLQYHIIPAARKLEILRQLSHLGFDDFGIFGDLDGLSKSLIKRYWLWPLSKK